MTARIPLAVFGAGWVVKHGYSPFLIPGGAFEVVSIYDPDPAAVAELVERMPGVATCASVEECLDSRARAVLIAAPSPAHVELSTRALRAGRHVLCEKPVAISSSQVRELIAAESAGGARLVGASVCRHRQDVRCFLGWAGELGTIDEMDLAWVRHRGVPSPGSWRTQEAGGATGVLADLGYHLLDLAVALKGTECDWVCSTATRSSMHTGSAAGWFGADAGPGPYEVEDRVEAVLVADGARLRIRVSWVDDEPGDITSLRVAGRSGTAELVGLFGYSDQRRVAEQVCTLRSTRLDRRAQFEPGPGMHALAFGSVLAELAMVCNGAKPSVGLAEIGATVRMLEAIRATGEHS